MPRTRTAAPPAPAGPARSPRGEQTLGRLLDGAVEVFERDGFLGARVTDIAGAAGVAHGTFYRYFGSKEDAFRAVAERVVDSMYRALDVDSDAGTPAARIRSVNRQYIELYERNAKLLGRIEQVATFDAGMRALRLRLRRRFVDRIARALERIQATGEARAAPLDAWTAANALGGMVDNFAYTWFVLDEPFERETALATLDAIWLRVLDLPDA